MSQSVEDIRADIAFMKNVVEDSGGRSARTGGAILMAGGGVNAICALVCYGAAAGYYPYPLGTQLSIWSAGSIVFLAALAAILIACPHGAQAPGDRGIAAAWTGAGWAIFTLAAACLGISLTTHQGMQWALFPSIVLGLYGACWFVAAKVARTGWAQIVAFACFAAAAGFGFLVTTPLGYAAFAACLVLLAVVPGFHLFRTASRA
jgi:hypothetical protein